jgi:hypothetical protein
MKKLLLSLSFILAVPILFSGHRSISAPFASHVSAQCLPDSGQVGNCIEYKRPRPSKSDGKTNGSGEMGLPIQEIGSGLAVLAPIFMIWLGLRR